MRLVIKYCFVSIFLLSPQTTLNLLERKSWEQQRSLNTAELNWPSKKYENVSFWRYQKVERRGKMKRKTNKHTLTFSISNFFFLPNYFTNVQSTASISNFSVMLFFLRDPITWFSHSTIFTTVGKTWEILQQHFNITMLQFPPFHKPHVYTYTLCMYFFLELPFHRFEFVEAKHKVMASNALPLNGRCMANFSYLIFNSVHDYNRNS